ncbi:phage shock protein PspA [Rhodospirillaceae bacterium KN72]|uniref:Phage shock protein PspA n=1 Tax=Pacificispira spongiicola TaxID=2729598 RepID=A0A7Y0DZ56_9PROT|nr:phage shock protein PspA [Pacificispira spongiicola]NMM44279.1 phage shock protein PspA [Pacificispira spongiicola]
MGIFSRMTDILNANVNALLDRAEDPEKMARLMIQEMEDTLVEVRSAAVRLIADKKTISRRLDEAEADRKEWGKKAEFALSREREDLAKAALLAKKRLGEHIDTLTREMAAIEESLAKYDDDLARLQSKLDEAKARRKAIEIRTTSAQNRVQMRRTLYDGRVDDALSRYESLERRIDDLESEAEGYDLGKKEDLATAFADLEAEEEIADELASLKAKMKK